MISIRKILILSALLLGVSAAGAREPSPPVPSGFPGIQGKVVRTASYADRSGRHTVVLTHSGYRQARPDPRDPGTVAVSADLRAYDFTRRGGELVWRMHDYVHGCVTSATAEFSADSPVITDLDRDGITEVWLIYYTGCHGDVSPDTMKILMYEGGRKHAMRGKTFVHVDGMDMGGRYVEDAAFAGAPAPIRRFARSLWKRHMRMTDIPAR